MHQFRCQLGYQIKNMRGDKLCIVTFLLPILVGLIINILPSVDFGTLGEAVFGSVQNDLPEEAVIWLQGIGSLTEYGTAEELKEAVENPSTQMIGVLRCAEGIRTVLSGDELELYGTMGKTLPQLYEKRTDGTIFEETVIPVSADYDGLRALLIAITLVTALFMGCTFNAMNIIGEKEDGVALVNQILPMRARTYILQKLALGFLGGTVSAVVTAFLCIEAGPAQIVPLCALVVLSAYIASLIGLFVGRFSSGLMVGIVYIKIVMILFLAPPILFYLLIPEDHVVCLLSYLLPSSASFYGLMDLLGGQTNRLWIHLVILAVHAVVLSGSYLFIAVSKESRR